MSTCLNVSKENEFNYNIYIESDFSKLADIVLALGYKGRKACIVADSNVAPLYKDEVYSELVKVFSKITTFVFEAGEKNKNLNTVSALYEHLILNKFDRKDVLIALGGGVTGDLTGFTASTYLRGIPFIQVPTTLLSQVDSSIGGKTGVDFLSYKNMVGAFYQPSLVYMNIKTCLSLPEVEFSCGMGEIIKHGLIKDKEYYHWIKNNAEAINSRNLSILESLIKRSCEIKKGVVERDPQEHGERALLNLGHTIGHAIEKLMDFQLHHGQCIALGYLASAYISYQKGYINLMELDEIKNLNTYFNLPNSIQNIDAKTILLTTKLDKKMEQGKIKFILLKCIGNAVIDNTITDNELLDSICYINGE